MYYMYYMYVYSTSIYSDQRMNCFDRHMGNDLLMRSSEMTLNYGQWYRPWLQSKTGAYIIAVVI